MYVYRTAVEGGERIMDKSSEQVRKYSAIAINKNQKNSTAQFF
jgi:hypothetical protein